MPSLSFVDHKNTFFLEKNQKKKLNSKDLSTEDIAFLAEHHLAIQEEFNDLERVYASYSTPLFNREVADAWRQEVVEMNNAYKTLFHESECVSYARYLITMTNLYRTSVRFSMLTLGSALGIAQHIHRIIQFEILIHLHLNMLVFESPIWIFNALSVGVFAFRFLINSFDFLQSLSPWPSDSRVLLLPFSTRLKMAWEKHENQLVNDVLWGIINLLSNYASYFHLSSPMSMYLMGGFLIFDVLWLSRSYFKELAKHNEKITEYKTLLTRSVQGSTEYKILQAQILEQELRFTNTKFLYGFYIVAAVSFIVGFGAFILFASPILSPLFFLICNVGMAMYFSGEAFGQYQEKNAIIQHMHTINQQTPNLYNEEDFSKAHAKKSEARNELIINMIENTCVPFMILMAFTISWPVAVTLTAGYAILKIGFELEEKQNRENKQEQNEEPDPLVKTIDRANNDDEMDDLDAHQQIGFTS